MFDNRRWIRSFCQPPIFVFLILLLCGWSTFARGVSARKIVEAAIARLDQLRTYGADLSILLTFKKRGSYEKNSEIPVTTRFEGRLIVDQTRKPARYRMEGTIFQFGLKIKKITVCDGKKVTVQFGEGDKAQYQTYDLKKSGVLSQQGGRRAAEEHSASRVLYAIVRNYSLKLVRSEIFDNDPVFVIQGRMYLRPPDGKYAGLVLPEQPKRIILRLSRRTLFPREFEAYEHHMLGFLKRKPTAPFALIQYDNIRINIPVRSSLFRIDIPIGVKVQDLTDQIRKKLRRK